MYMRIFGAMLGRELGIDCNNYFWPLPSDRDVNSREFVGGGNDGDRRDGKP